MSSKFSWNTPALQAIQHNFMQGLLTMSYDIARDARAGAPVDTGNLKASIRVVANDNGADIIAGGTIGKVAIAGKSPLVDYALYQELGTSKMKGKHYMKNAFEKTFGNNAWQKKYFGGITR